MKHDSVLLNEAIEGLRIQPNGIYVDGTLGGGGHAEAILKQLKTGFLFAFDQDPFAIAYAQKRLEKYPHFQLINRNFIHLEESLNELGVTLIDGLLLDLGMSSFQIDDANRGFSYLEETSLDMRMDPNQTLTAETIVNTYEFAELRRIFTVYGEEKMAHQIAKRIVDSRPLKTTSDLVKITDQVNRNQKGHSAKRVFQALRIAVNNELDVLEAVLKQALRVVKPGGRIVVISFHSLEDRIVKHFFKEESTSKLPKNFPGLIDETFNLKVITRKPILPTEAEMNENPRAKSAKLRIAERI
ncbi:MAG: 16S rRNA (cytosine(1402)-N(4))-methyltransferase RsmH [Acholeplasmataceae bacterium]|nr:16S rRNA (cytosine(1402)-N(4))-methyltransferase RsmH [Acholeplasmataceae bacterium]